MMYFFDFMKALVLMGLPFFAFTYTIHWWALRKGHIAPFSQAEEIEQELDKDGDNKTGWLMENWVTFGGGYYGAMAFFTYLFLELGQLYEAIIKLARINFTIEALIKFLISEFTDAILNMVHAFIWFSYWPDVFDMAFQPSWLAVTYGAYLLAIKITGDNSQSGLKSA